jgi:hypothetical protein
VSTITLEIEITAKGRLHAMKKQTASMYGLTVNKMSTNYMNRSVQSSLHSVFYNTVLGKKYDIAIRKNAKEIVGMILTKDIDHVSKHLTKLFKTTYIVMAKGKKSTSNSKIKLHNLYAIGTAETLDKSVARLREHNMTHTIKATI